MGTGTDPAEGAALGIALLRALVAGGPRAAAFTMATTHHRCCAPTQSANSHPSISWNYIVTIIVIIMDTS